MDTALEPPVDRVPDPREAQNAALSRERDENSDLRAALTFLDNYLRSRGRHGPARQTIRKHPCVRALLDE